MATEPKAKKQKSEKTEDAVVTPIVDVPVEPETSIPAEVEPTETPIEMPAEEVEAVLEEELGLEEVAPEAAVKPGQDWKDAFHPGDKVVVNYKIKEGEKFRIQPFEGIVIARKGMGQSRTFTVRRIATGSIGVERIFPLYSPNIESVVVKAHGKVRRAKLYYIRERVGKAATKIKESK